jgi:hypothetical protein
MRNVHIMQNNFPSLDELSVREVSRRDVLYALRVIADEDVFSEADDHYRTCCFAIAWLISTSVQISACTTSDISELVEQLLIELARRRYNDED